MRVWWALLLVSCGGGNQDSPSTEPAPLAVPGTPAPTAPEPTPAPQPEPPAPPPEFPEGTRSLELTRTVGVRIEPGDGAKRSELVHFEPPAPGDTVTRDTAYGEVESVKAVSDVIAPLSGEVLEVNEKAVEAPETVNEDPYGDGWLIRIRLSDPSETGTLLDVEAYKQVLAEL